LCRDAAPPSLIHPLAIANGGISDMHPQALPSIRQQFPTQAIINLAGTLIINRVDLEMS